MLIRCSAGGQVKTTLKIVVGSCLALAFAFLSSPVQASAHATTRTLTAASSPTLQVDVGFEGSFKRGYWTPVFVGVSNGDSAFAGTLSVSTFSGQGCCKVGNKTKRVGIKKDLSHDMNG